MADNTTARRILDTMTHAAPVKDVTVKIDTSGAHSFDKGSLWKSKSNEELYGDIRRLIANKFERLGCSVDPLDIPETPINWNEQGEKEMNTITVLFLLVLAVYLTVWAAKSATYGEWYNVFTWWRDL